MALEASSIVESAAPVVQVQVADRLSSQSTESAVVAFVAVVADAADADADAETERIRQKVFSWSSSSTSSFESTPSMFFTLS